MSLLRVPLFTLICHYLLPQLGFCEAYQNCLVALIKITTVSITFFETKNFKKNLQKESIILTPYHDTLIFFSNKTVDFGIVFENFCADE